MKVNIYGLPKSFLSPNIITTVTLILETQRVGHTFGLAEKKNLVRGHGLIVSLGLMAGNMTGDCRITQHLKYTTT